VPAPAAAPAPPPPLPATLPEEEPADPALPTPPAEVAETPAEPAPEPVAVGRLRVTSNKRALIYIDGAPVGFTPMDVELAPGSHTVRVMQPGQSDTIQTRAAEIVPGEEQELSFSF